MDQAGGDRDLPEESVPAHRGGDLGVQHLDGHRPPVPAVTRQVDPPHAAPTDLRFHLIGIASASRT